MSDATDANLYRYVGNTPTVYIDPTGLILQELSNGFSGATEFVNENILQPTGNAARAFYIGFRQASREFTADVQTVETGFPINASTLSENLAAEGLDGRVYQALAFIGNLPSGLILGGVNQLSFVTEIDLLNPAGTFALDNRLSVRADLIRASWNFDGNLDDYEQKKISILLEGASETLGYVPNPITSIAGSALVGALGEALDPDNERALQGGFLRTASEAFARNLIYEVLFDKIGDSASGGLRRIFATEAVGGNAISGNVQPRDGGSNPLQQVFAAITGGDDTVGSATGNSGSFGLINQLGRGKTLLVGEGNLSFSASLIRQRGIRSSNVIASVYEAQLAPLAQLNADVLKEAGSRVLLGVDAGNLSNSLGVERFDAIIFNNPNTGVRPAQPTTKRLLRDFFGSARKQLNDNGTVVVTLKNSRFYRGFRVEEQAARAGFKLVDARVIDLAKEVPGFTHAQTNEIARSASFPNGSVQYTFVRRDS